MLIIHARVDNRNLNRITVVFGRRTLQHVVNISQFFEPCFGASTSVLQVSFDMVPEEMRGGIVLQVRVVSIRIIRVIQLKAPIFYVLSIR